LFVFEKFHLAKAFFRLFPGLVRAAQIFALLGKDLITAGDFLDHQFAPRWIAGLVESCTGKSRDANTVSFRRPGIGHRARSATNAISSERRAVRRDPVSSSIHVADYIESVVKAVARPIFPEPLYRREHGGKARRAGRATDKITDNARPQPGESFVITAAVRVRRSHAFVEMNNAAPRARQCLFGIQVESVTSGNSDMRSVRPLVLPKSAGFPGCQELIERRLGMSKGRSLAYFSFHRILGRSPCFRMFMAI